MNKKDIETKHREFKDLIKRDSLYATRVGCAKCWGKTTYEHWRTLSDIVWWLVNNGYEVFSEVEFKSGGRADLVCWQNGQGFIIEVLHSETEKRYEAKFSTYPEELTMVRIDTKGFNIDEFCL